MVCRKCNKTIPDDAVYCPYCRTKQIIATQKHPRSRANGVGTAYKRGRTWTAKVTVGKKAVIVDGVPKVIYIRATKGGFKKKTDALQYCPTLLREAKEKSTRKEKSKLTVQQIYDAWLPTHETKVGKSTMDCYRAAWKYFSPLKEENFCDIDLDDLQECVDDCGKGRRTKENMKALAGLLFKYALPRHRTDMNYAEFIHTGTDEKGTRPAFSKEQVELIRQQIGKIPHAEDVYVLIYTGFRPTELFNLTKDSYKDGVLYGGIKTQAGKDRAVPVSKKIESIVVAHMENKSDYLFPRDDGERMSSRYFRDNYFYPILAAAGIQALPTSDKPAYYVPYSTRHTFSNMLKDIPGSDTDKAGLMGHEDYRTTKKQYQSAELDALKKIVDAL